MCENVLHLNKARGTDPAPVSLSVRATLLPLFTFMLYYKKTMSRWNKRLQGNYLSLFKHKVKHNACIPERFPGIKGIRSHSFSCQSHLTIEHHFVMLYRNSCAWTLLVMGLCTCLFHSLIIAERVTVFSFHSLLPWFYFQFDICC